MTELDTEYDTKRKVIMERRRRHLDKGRCFMDVCRETRDDVVKLQLWYATKTQLAKDTDFVETVAQSVTSETLARVYQFLHEREPAAVPSWAHLIPRTVDQHQSRRPHLPHK